MKIFTILYYIPNLIRVLFAKICYFLNNNNMQLLAWSLVSNNALRLFFEEQQFNKCSYDTQFYFNEENGIKKQKRRNRRTNHQAYSDVQSGCLESSMPCQESLCSQRYELVHSVNQLLIFAMTLNYFNDSPNINWFITTSFHNRVSSTPVLFLHS